MRQVHDMKAHGMGGFFMHSREGLETTYLGPEWMEGIRRTVAAAKQAGMHAWLYDEDRWPSGFAGGLVPARGGDAFRAKGLTMEIASGEVALADDVVAVYRAKVQAGTLLEARRVEAQGAVAPGAGEVLVVLRREVASASEWYNNDAPADNLNPESVAAFLDITYEAYRREVGQEFGKTVPGIFTDEPNINHMPIKSGRPYIPWTDGLAEFFAERRGYDFLDVAPFVFLDGQRSLKARHDYWWTAGERYVQAFSKQLGQWCDAHHIALTGHYLCESPIGIAIVSSGSVMAHYPYQAVPGIDILCEHTTENLTVKQCTSVAHQYGREIVLSETYGCSGWEFTFEGQKWVGDWQYVLGVSLRCQHLALYTLRGCRKRDYPPSFNYNATWWKYNAVVEDYFARLGLVLTKGEPLRDVLVIHPVTTGWSLVSDTRGVDAADRLGTQLDRFVRAVLACHYDFDFGDELTMAHAARCQHGCLVVEQAPYKVVVVPPGTQTLLRTTVELLERFVEAGGRVIAFQPGPRMIEATPDDRVAALLRHERVALLSDETGLQAALEASVPRRVSILNDQRQEAPSVLCMQRDLEDGKSALFVVNNDRNSGYALRIALEGRGRLEEWDLLTGETRVVPVQVKANAVAFDAQLGPAGSCLYLLDTSQPPLTEKPAPRHSVEVAYIGPVCAFARTDPNVLTLDACAYRIQSGRWSAAMPLWQAQRAVRQQLGMRPVFSNGIPQRYKWVDQPHEKDRTPVAFRFGFEVQEVPAEPLHLLVENAEDFQIQLNGQEVPNAPVGWYLDRAFDRVALPRPKRGANVLSLCCAYEQRMEVEDCFLLGDFGVSPNRAIVSEPQRLHFGDWCTQGYFHYPGSIVYYDELSYAPQSGERIRLVLGDYSAVTVALHVNERLAGHIPWRSANGLDITPYLRAGANRIGIEVVGSPRNMLGPLHMKAGRELYTSCSSFRTEGDRYTSDYVVHPYGLFGQVKIVRETQGAA